MASYGEGGERVETADKYGGTMFITQRAQVTGQKMQKAVKLPRIDSAKGVDVITQSSQSTELLQANQEMAQVQGELDAAKMKFQELMARCKEKEEALSLKTAKLDQEGSKFSVFLKETQAKKARAVRRTQEESTIRMAKEEEAKQLQLDLQDNQKNLEQSKKNLEAADAYKTYLERVVETSEDFQEIGDILKRYETLEAYHETLQNSVRDNMTNAENSRRDLHKLTKDLQNEVLVQSSVIADNQDRLERAKVATAEEEHKNEEREEKAKDVISQLGEGQMATFNLYNRCRSTHMAESRPKVEERDVMKALKYIEERFISLKDIVTTAQQRGLVGDTKVRDAVVDRMGGGQGGVARGGDGGRGVTRRDHGAAGSGRVGGSSVLQGQARRPREGRRTAGESGDPGASAPLESGSLSGSSNVLATQPSLQ